MQSKKIIIFILASFITGTLLLVYIQYNSSKNINKLIEGNETLMNVIEVNSKLNQLEKTIIKVESKVRGAIVIKNPTSIVGIDNEILEIKYLLKQLQRLSSGDSSLFYINSLDTLMQEKLLFNEEVLNYLHAEDKLKAVKLISSSKSKNLTDSILSTIQEIDNSRSKHLTYAIESIDTSGKKAQQFSFVLIGIVLICGAALFWYIINTIRRQISLIRRLNISEKKVIESARIKEIFIANMSHEIRTPMNAILGFTRLLQNKNMDEESMEYVQTIEQSGENLLALINDILDLSKIEVGMLKIEKKSFSIRDLLHSIKVMFYNKAAEKSIILATEIDDSIPDFLMGDAVRLTQILINLAGNALKFTQEGSITIKISNEGKTPESINLGMTVTDTGIGIVKEKQQQIFERFEQAEDSIIRNYGGSGLGLSIVSDLVKLQNGTIEVDSEPGKGSAFKLMIPLGISPDGNLRNDDLEVDSGFKDPNVLGRILVVEDNLINQSLIKHLFKNWKLTYDLANNGQEALGKLQSEKYAMILMDIQMPVMDGYTTTQEIRQTLKLTTPVIAMTAHALAVEKEKCLEYGMTDYISKPLRENQLHHLIDQYAQMVINDVSSPESLPDPEGFVFINLNYMKEISSGNKEYEKLVTEQFMEAIPEDLAAIDNAWKSKDISRLRHVVHNMKTTVSVMGLNDSLQQYFDVLENGEMDETKFQENFREVTRICSGALEEANRFYSIF